MDCEIDAGGENAAADARHASLNGACPVRRWWRRPIPLTLTASLVLLVVYAAYERIGTVANADTVEYLTNYAGGFLAIGMTDAQPGFIVLSALDRKQVDVSAEQRSSLPAGTRTFVEIRTPRQYWEVRLRKPQVLIVNEDGSANECEVRWGLADFVRIRAATDCSHQGKDGKHRCGVPFADLQDLVDSRKIVDVPGEVRAFLKSRAKH